MLLSPAPPSLPRNACALCGLAKWAHAGRDAPDHDYLAPAPPKPRCPPALEQQPAAPAAAPPPPTLDVAPHADPLRLHRRALKAYREHNYARAIQLYSLALDACEKLGLPTHQSAMLFANRAICHLVRPPPLPPLQDLLGQRLSA
eukprot:COSAG04_NODE_504_length_13347_cov_231.910251_6_plen_145_part_00